MKWALVFACVLVCLVGRNAALKCYQCNLGNSACKDPFDKDANNNLLQECQFALGLSGACWKIKTNDVVTRSCTAKATCDAIGGLNACGDNASGANACCCTTDGCNGATTTSISYLAVTALLVLTKALH
ncbi:uncharacterized protein LOC110982393 [Acanthaster planci]|uniref:Uncharacterized protein LOC110982393 n=1 Tax=Acanthaster planci TaxID=133434 RepID=A0A8B7YT39_ACAPL|nr:uncharacterized protein LOC110982393 [Acanthaster planci]XP_022096454.1 uncharacterized protein LOC110982393 [Acanthaster planci]